MQAFEEDQSSWLFGMCAICFNVSDSFPLKLSMNLWLGLNDFPGDSAYGSAPWLLGPLHDAAPGTPEAYYTQRHCNARCTIERCFGCLKMRWRCLCRERFLHYAPDKAANIFKSVCLLHNMCRLVSFMKLCSIYFKPRPFAN